MAGVVVEEAIFLVSNIMPISLALPQKS